MSDLIKVVGFLIGVGSIAAVVLLLVAGIALTCVQRGQDGDL